MNRISIVGPPVDGKSTFARALAAKTNLPLQHLDFYYHETGKDYENNNQAWLDKITELTSNESWIIEGNYGSSYEQRISKSDTLIFMDMPSWLTIWSVLKRRIEYRNKKRLEMPDDWVEKINLVFFKFVVMFRINSRQDVLDGIEKYKHKNLEIITFKSRKAAYKWLDKLE